jgi:hypothetical protein
MRADDRTVIRVPLGEQRMCQRFFYQAIGFVFEGLAALVAHHVLLDAERFLVEHVEQIAHAVGVHP